MSNIYISNQHKNNLIYGLLIWGVLMSITSIYFSNYRACPYLWHGGNPHFKGSCWCGKDDQYCLCTPSLAIDAIIEVRKSTHSDSNFNSNDIQIVLVKRKDPPSDIFAIPGGFVEIGDTVESTVIREVKEETNLDITIANNHLEQFRVYSNPHRDKRRHTVSSVHRCLITTHDTKNLAKGDDAKQVVVVSLKSAIHLPLAFDHYEILTDYMKRYHPSLLEEKHDTLDP